MLPDPACYVGIERDPEFRRMLVERYPEMHVVEGSAEQAQRHVAEAGRARVKAVLCGLPFASLPPSVQDGVIQALDGMIQPGSEFRTFQYVHSYGLPTAIRFRRRMNSLFGRGARSRVVLRNVPPAFVLTWRR
jgi:phospholipid N-methyltransferase